MGTKVKKSIFKPLRYISSMFESKEQEIQIGHPTDVKHVAHIGWDGPNVNAPSWMKDFHSAPLNSTSFNGGDERENPATNLWGSHEYMRAEQSSPQSTGLGSRPRSSIENSVNDTSNNMPAPSRARQARRNQSDGIATADSSNREASEGSSRRRRPRRKEATNGTDLPPQNPGGIPKQSNRRRPKGSTGGGGDSVRSSRAKAASTTSAAAEDTARRESINKPQEKFDRCAEEEEDSE